jgi:hypothetical protein
VVIGVSIWFLFSPPWSGESSIKRDPIYDFEVYPFISSIINLSIERIAIPFANHKIPFFKNSINNSIELEKLDEMDDGISISKVFIIKIIENRNIK